MSYYGFNRQEVLQKDTNYCKKAKGKYDNCGGKEKRAEYYQVNKARNKYKNLSEKEKEEKTKYSKNRYNENKEK